MSLSCRSALVCPPRPPDLCGAKKIILLMPFHPDNLLLDHHLDRLEAADLADHVAHVLCTRGRLDFTFDGRPFALQAGETMIIVVRNLLEDLRPSNVKSSRPRVHRTWAT